MTLLECKELGRYYGQVVGLNELTTTLAGGVIGLVGPNGAGKSTLLRLIVGEIEPSRGEVRVLGEKPFANRELYRRLGFCPQQDALYEDMSGFEIVRLLLRLGGFAPAEARARTERALERLNMTERMHDRVRTYSKGMRQRVRIAQSIAHDPEVLLLDEPLTGLDPVGRRALRGLFRALADRGASILLSSHVLHEVEATTDRILLLHRARLLAVGTVSDIRGLLDHHPHSVEVACDRPRELAARLVGLPEVESLRVPSPDLLVVQSRTPQALYPAVVRAVQEGGFRVARMGSPDDDLEAVFRYLVRR